MEERTETAKDEEDRKELRPSVDVAGAVRLCNSIWDIGQEVEERGVAELDGYDDRNFIVRVGGGGGGRGRGRGGRGVGAVEGAGTTERTKYVLKFHNGVESARFSSAIDMQNALLVYLRERGLNVNAPVPTRTGELVRMVEAPVHGGGSAPIAARLLSFVEGRVMKEVKEQSTKLLEAAGRFVGEMDHLLDAFEHGGMRRPHLWDTRSSLELRQFLACVPEEHRRAMCERVLSSFETHVLPLAEEESEDGGAGLRMGIIHGDANDTNLLIDHDDDEKIVGVIDFSDSLYSWRVCEIGISAAYAMLRKADPVSDAIHVIRGYTSVYPLLDAEVSALPTLIGCRLVCTCVLGAYSYSQDPGNEYLLATFKPGWDALEALVTAMGPTLDARIRDACAQTKHP